MTTKDMDLDCYWINLETADNEAFKKMITDELKSKIDTLQRYKPNEFPSENEVYTMEEFYNRDNSLMLKSIVWEYIRYDDLKKLLLQ